MAVFTFLGPSIPNEKQTSTSKLTSPTLVTSTQTASNVLSLIQTTQAQGIQ